MAEEDKQKNEVVALTKGRELFVVRTTVPVGLEYGDYRQYLRTDFLFSCAYCTVTEFEASGIRFTIDHYEPKSIRPDLQHDYENLMYACDVCNQRKGYRSPSELERTKDFRFFR